MRFRIMSSTRHLFVMAILALAVQQTVSARTLFIDLNNAEPEIAAIRQGVGGQAEEVVVIPSYERISKQDRLGVLRAQRDVDKFTEEAQACAVATRKPKGCHDVYDRIRQAELRREGFIRYYTTEDLEEELVRLAIKDVNKPFDMVVISGHHEEGYYMGELAKIRSARLAEVVKSLPTLFKPVDTLLMLGCSTGTQDNFSTVLSPMFPTIPVIVAAEDRAPLRDEPRNISFVRKVMDNRAALLKARTPKQVESVYGGLLAKNWPVSILWRQKLVFFKDSTEPLIAKANATQNLLDTGLGTN
jgi:hypothetical protein